jgi:hypothetical protein
MTKFILHGGETKVKCESNALYFDEMSSDIPEAGMILFVFFSRTRDRWADAFSGWIENICESDKLPDDVNFECAVPDKFLDQLNRADVVCFTCGQTKLLMDTINGIEGALDALKNYEKTVGGSSAGANMLSKFGYSEASGEAEAGFGLIETKVLVHSDKPEFKNGLKALKSAGDVDMEIIHLPETKFKVITK